MKKMQNLTKIVGTLYETTLEERTSSDGEYNYIVGKLSLEVAPNNIVSVDFFEKEMTTRGKNKKYDTLKSLIDTATILNGGADEAPRLNITSALTVDTFTPKGATTPINITKNFGGFVNFASPSRKFEPKATFQADMLITGTSPVMVSNPELGGELAPADDAIYVNGYIFDFAKRIMPVQFRVNSESGVKYFQEIEPNTFTEVWGVEETIVKSNKKIIPSSFGEDKVIETTDIKKEFIITGSLAEPYPFDTEGILTAEEVRQAKADRELYLASREQKMNDKPKQNTAIINNKSDKKYHF